jgi:hypothetical protein
MQYQKLLALIPILALVNQTPVLAQEVVIPKPTEQSTEQNNDNFWRQTEDLVQSQVSLIDRLSIVLTTASAEQLDQAQLQLLRNDTRVNNFLRAENRDPQAICQGIGNTTDNANNSFTNQQQQVYCTLYSSRQRLIGLMPVLNRRLGLLQLGNNPLLSGNIPVLDPRFSTPTATFSQPNVRARLPEFGSVIIGSPAKPAIADFRPPLLPAIAPAAEIQQITQSVRQELVATATAFPANIIFTADPNPQRGIQEALLPSDFSQYQAFLQQPNTGITRILPAALRPQRLNQIQSRLQPTIAQEFPFTSVITVNDSPTTARLSLEVDNNGNLQIAQPGLDYGFIWNLGDVEVDQVARNQGNLNSRPEYRFFFSYAPPSRLEELQVDRRRFLTGKLDNFAPDGLRSRGVPLVLNQTYLVRLVQFQLPAPLVNREVIPRRDRRYLDQILQTPSSDIVVALRPIELNNDGSYTMIWQLVNQFPNPQVLDLTSYLDLE